MSITSQGQQEVTKSQSVIASLGLAANSELTGSLVQNYNGLWFYIPFSDNCVHQADNGNIVLVLASGFDAASQPSGLMYKTPLELDDTTEGGQGLRLIVPGAILPPASAVDVTALRDALRSRPTIRLNGKEVMLLVKQASIETGITRLQATPFPIPPSASHAQSLSPPDSIEGSVEEVLAAVGLQARPWLHSSRTTVPKPTQLELDMIDSMAAGRTTFSSLSSAVPLFFSVYKAGFDTSQPDVGWRALLRAVLGTAGLTERAQELVIAVARHVERDITQSSALEQIGDADAQQQRLGADVLHLVRMAERVWAQFSPSGISMIATETRETLRQVKEFCPADEYFMKTLAAIKQWHRGQRPPNEFSSQNVPAPHNAADSQQRRMTLAELTRRSPSDSPDTLAAKERLARGPSRSGAAGDSPAARRLISGNTFVGSDGATPSGHQGESAQRSLTSIPRCSRQRPALSHVAHAPPSLSPFRSEPPTVATSGRGAAGVRAGVVPSLRLPAPPVGVGWLGPSRDASSRSVRWLPERCGRPASLPIDAAAPPATALLRTADVRLHRATGAATGRHAPTVGPPPSRPSPGHRPTYPQPPSNSGPPVYGYSHRPFQGAAPEGGFRRDGEFNARPFKPDDNLVTDLKLASESDAETAVSAQAVTQLASRPFYEEELRADPQRSLGFDAEARRWQGSQFRPAVQSFLTSVGRTAAGGQGAKVPRTLPNALEARSTLVRSFFMKQLGPEREGELRKRVVVAGVSIVTLRISDIDELIRLGGGVKPTGQFTLTREGVAMGSLGNPDDPIHIVRAMVFLERIWASFLPAVFGDDPEQVDGFDRWGLEEMAVRFTSACEVGRAKRGLREFFAKLTEEMDKRSADLARMQQFLGMASLIASNLARVEATLTQSQLVAEQVREQLSAQKGLGNSGPPQAAPAAAPNPRKASGGTPAVVCKALDNMTCDGSRLGAIRMIEAGMRKSAGISDWQSHKEPTPGEGCPWVALFGKCSNAKCPRCADGAGTVNKSLVAQVKAAFRAAAPHSDSAKSTQEGFAA